MAAVEKWLDESDVAQRQGRDGGDAHVSSPRKKIHAGVRQMFQQTEHVDVHNLASGGTGGGLLACLFANAKAACAAKAALPPSAHLLQPTSDGGLWRAGLAEASGAAKQAALEWVRVSVYHNPSSTYFWPEALVALCR